MIDINEIMNNDDWSLFEFKKISDDIPKVKAVYFLMNDDELLYIGQTQHLRSRIERHFITKNLRIFVGNVRITEDEFNGLYFIEVEDDLSRKIMELCYIYKYQPKLNVSI